MRSPLPLTRIGPVLRSTASPRDPRAESRFRRGNEALDAGALTEAAEMMEQALALAPDWAGGVGGARRRAPRAG